MKFKPKFILFILFMIFSNINIAQEQKAIKIGIVSALTSKYGKVDFIGSIVDVNYEKNQYQQSILPITDPYGTLEDCHIFTANLATGGLVGIYRNNILIWDSAPIVDLYNTNLDFKIIGTLDLNQDNNIEIIAAWNYGVSGFTQNLWIFTWNFANGILINKTKENSFKSGIFKSEIWSLDYLTDIVDVDGDGILEIKGISKGNSSDSKIYSWNGENYGDFGVDLPNILPMDKLSINVICKVEVSNYGLIYNYSVQNLAMSTQKVWRFSIEKPYEFVKAGSADPNNKWGHHYSDNWNIFNWNVSKNPNTYPCDFIEPGEERKGFKLETDNKMVYIGNFYVQGKNGRIEYSDKYIKENSFIGKTICARKTNDMGNNLIFIDSLLMSINKALDLNWIKNETTYNKYKTFLTNAKSALEQGDTNLTRTHLQSIITNVDIDSSSSLTSEAYALLKYNTEYLLEQLPEIEEYPYLKVNLKDSQGNLINECVLQYYDAGWKNAVNNGDGTFNVETERTSVSLRMFFDGASQTVSNVDVQNNTFTFTTVQAKIQLQNSQGNLLDGGSVQYYASGWKNFGDVLNGEVTKELLPKDYSFRMSYGGTSLDKKQDIAADQMVVFQTANANVQLKNSQGNLLNGGSVQYYASGWKELGDVLNGEVTKELLPKEYSFRMHYGGTSVDKKQDITADQVVVFQTVNVNVQLKDNRGNLFDGGSVQYYASGWKNFGDALNGEVTKELLPKVYSFRMSYGGTSVDKKQDIASDKMVVFETVNVNIQLKDSQGNLLDGGSVQYYASGWKELGDAVIGQVTKELLPKAYSFRMNYSGTSIDKKQDIASDKMVVFQTVNAHIQLKDSQGNLLDGDSVQYYASGWKDLGDAFNGEVTKELLPKEYSFRMNYGGTSIDKKQDIGTESLVVFQTVNCVIKVFDGENQQINTALVLYYASGWKQIGNTVNGEITMELLPKIYSFRVSSDSINKDLKQDIGVNNIVEFTIN